MAEVIGAIEGKVLPDGTARRRDGDVLPYSMGRMEYRWGPGAATFRPERWIGDNNVLVLPNVSLFKAGLRICLGKDSNVPPDEDVAIMCRFFRL